MGPVLQTSAQGVDLKKDVNCYVISALFGRQIPFLGLMYHLSLGLSAQVVLNNAGWVSGERATILEQVGMNNWCE